MKKCPFCEEQIQEDAVKCRYCKEWLSQPGEATQEPDNITGQNEAGVPPTPTDYLSIRNEKKRPDRPPQQSAIQPQAVNSSSAIEPTEIWFSRNYKALLVLAITLPLLAAIAIPLYLVMNERTRNAQNQLAPAPPAAQRTSPVGDNKTDLNPVQSIPEGMSAEPALPPGHKALILMADKSLDRTPAKAVNIFIKYKLHGSDKDVSKIVMQNVPVISYSVAERQIKIHIPDEDYEKLKIARAKGKLQVLPIR